MDVVLFYCSHEVVLETDSGILLYYAIIMAVDFRINPY